MTKVNQIFRCNVCGNIVESVHEGAGELVCCGQKMQLMAENSVDAAKEKHIPVIECTAGGIKVTVGEVDHPMEEKHYIEWIEIIFDGRVGKQFLRPGDSPEAFFSVSPKEITARAYCNLHGLWKSK